MDPVDLAAARRRDPVRVALVETIYADPPRIGGFLVALQLAAAVLDYNLMRRDAALLGYLALDAVTVLRQRRAPASGADRARQLGMRKGTYLAMRGHLLRVLRRLLAVGSTLREPKTPASRHSGNVPQRGRVILRGKAQDQREAAPASGGAESWGASPGMGAATETRSGDRRAKPQFEELSNE